MASLAYINLLELQQEIDRDTAKYVRHALRPSPSSGSSTVSPSPSASRAPSPKSSHLPAKVADAYAEIRQLGDDKCLLAKRLIELLTRTRSRLDVDLNKVRILQGELADYHAVSTRSASVLSSPAIGGQSDILYGRNPAQQISESLRNALGGSASMPDVKSASALPPPPAFASVPIPKSMSLLLITVPRKSRADLFRYRTPLRNLDLRQIGVRCFTSTIFTVRFTCSLGCSKLSCSLDASTIPSFPADPSTRGC